jgi:hypothetical protein
MVNISFCFVHSTSFTNSRNVFGVWFFGVWFFGVWFLLKFLSSENEMLCPSDAFILNPLSVTTC